MRLSNKNRKPIYNFIYSLIGILFLLGVIAYILELNKLDVFGDKAWVLYAVPALLFLLVFSLGRPIFDYDSDGEALSFRNNHVLPFMKKSAKDEFPKYKLLKYNLVNGFVFKKLYIYISSKKNHVTVLKYDISYLSRKEVRDLKFSLNKVIKANRENMQKTNRENV